MKNDIPSFTLFDSRNEFHQKNFFAAASCWLLQEKTQRISSLHLKANKPYALVWANVLLVHDVAEK